MRKSTDIDVSIESKLGEKDQAYFTYLKKLAAGEMTTAILKMS